MEKISFLRSLHASCSKAGNPALYKNIYKKINYYYFNIESKFDIPNLPEVEMGPRPGSLWRRAHCMCWGARLGLGPDEPPLLRLSSCSSKKASSVSGSVSPASLSSSSSALEDSAESSSEK